MRHLLQLENREPLMNISHDGIRALFTETAGTGNWVNFNKKSGEQNRFYQKSGDLDKLKFPPQKAAIFPNGISFADWHP